MRVFIAIDLSKECKAYLSSIMKEIRGIFNNRGAFVPLENFHITLEFLSERDEDEITTIKRIMDDVVGRSFSFKIPGGIGSFATRDRNKRTYFLETEHSNALNELQWNLHQALQDEGFILEKRRYHPHITLLRNGYMKECIPSFPSFCEKVASIHLMKSERVNGRMVYTSIHERLLDNPV